MGYAKMKSVDSSIGEAKAHLTPTLNVKHLLPLLMLFQSLMTATSKLALIPKIFELTHTEHRVQVANTLTKQIQRLELPIYQQVLWPNPKPNARKPPIKTPP